TKDLLRLIRHKRSKVKREIVCLLLHLVKFKSKPIRKGVDFMSTLCQGLTPLFSLCFPFVFRNFVELKKWWRVLRLKLLGHYRYYGISGNFQELRKFYILTSRLAYKWINRRSQKKSFTYRKYCRFKEFNPLPEPKIYHLTYTLSS
ncbi:hypothetical protein KJ693_10400, partial [bacterium]|nr:hypothetical protein [bacterium]